ncbi:MAG: hypothetical protein JXC36_02085, partial [Candidatus Atribacteria bacterium]|nr:hypothetical protein [Candidatus Atribacteria bacterium]
MFSNNHKEYTQKLIFIPLSYFIAIQRFNCYYFSKINGCQKEYGTIGKLYYRLGLERKKMIDLTINWEQLERTIQRARERNIMIPTFAQMKNPELISAGIKEKLRNIGLWDIDAYNLFRITWKNEPQERG